MCQDARPTGLITRQIPDFGRGRGQGTWFQNLVELAVNFMLGVGITPIDVRFGESQNIYVGTLGCNGQSLCVTKAITRFNAINILKVESDMIVVLGEKGITPGIIGLVGRRECWKIMETCLDAGWGRRIGCGWWRWEWTGWGLVGDGRGTAKPGWCYWDLGQPGGVTRCLLSL